MSTTSAYKPGDRIGVRRVTQITAQTVPLFIATVDKVDPDRLWVVTPIHVRHQVRINDYIFLLPENVVKLGDTG